MRGRLAAAALVAGTALAVLPAAPASAYCDPVLYAVTGGCTNVCKILTPQKPCLQ